VKNIKMGDGDKIRELLRRVTGGGDLLNTAQTARKEDKSITKLTNYFKNKIAEEKSTQQDEGSTLSKLYQKIMPENAIKKFGKFFSNSVYPYGYTGKKNELSGYMKNFGKEMIGIDEPYYGKEYNPNDFQPDLPGRDYLLRSGFGLEEEEANRMGGADVFKRLDKSNLILNPKNPMGTDIQKRLDEYAKHEFLKRFIPGYEVPEDVDEDYTGMPILAGIEFNPQGEGQDEKGYYVKYGGRDPWDFSLKGGNTGESRKNLLKLIRRSIDANLINKQTVNYEGKYHVPGIKKQPKQRRVSGTPLTGIYESEYD